MSRRLFKARSETKIEDRSLSDILGFNEPTESPIFKDEFPLRQETCATALVTSGIEDDQASATWRRATSQKQRTKFATTRRIDVPKHNFVMTMPPGVESPDAPNPCAFSSSSSRQSPDIVAVKGKELRSPTKTTSRNLPPKARPSKKGGMSM